MAQAHIAADDHSHDVNALSVGASCSGRFLKGKQTPTSHPTWEFITDADLVCSVGTQQDQFLGCNVGGGGSTPVFRYLYPEYIKTNGQLGPSVLGVRGNASGYNEFGQWISGTGGWDQPQILSIAAGAYSPDFNSCRQLDLQRVIYQELLDGEASEVSGDSAHPTVITPVGNQKRVIHICSGLRSGESSDYTRYVKVDCPVRLGDEVQMLLTNTSASVQGTVQVQGMYNRFIDPYGSPVQSVRFSEDQMLRLVAVRLSGSGDYLWRVGVR